MAGIRFPDLAPITVQELYVIVKELVDQLSVAAVAKMINGVAIGTTVTRVAHGLGTIPSQVQITTRSSTTISRVQPPDSQFLYLQAAVATDVDILVIP